MLPKQFCIFPACSILAALHVFQYVSTLIQPINEDKNAAYPGIAF